MAEFKNAEELVAWLGMRGVNATIASSAGLLYAKGFIDPSTLEGITVEALLGQGVPFPSAQSISNKLKSTAGNSLD